MSEHELKNCPRCNKPIKCKTENITQCQCYGIVLTEELIDFIEARFNECLCGDCLIYLQQELDLIKEKRFIK